MRLAIVTRELSRQDGQARVNWEIAVAALARGHEVDLVCERADPALAHAGATIRALPPPSILPSRLLRDQLFAWRSRAALRGEPSVVLANGFATWASSDVNCVHFVHRAWLASPHHPCRETVSPRSLYALIYSAVNAWLEQNAFSHARVVIAVSDRIRHELEQAGVPPARIFAIANGVDTAEFRPAIPGEQAMLRARFGLPPNGFVALFAGELKTGRKNLGTVLDALARVDGVHLAVAGRHDGTPWPARAAALGLDGRIHFLGFQQDMPAVVRAADLLLFPSRYEPFGLVLLEALATGVPVITCAAVGAATLLTMESGIVLPASDDAPALAAAIAGVVGNPPWRHAAALAARNVALTHDWKDVAGRYVDVLQAVAAQASERTSAVSRPRRHAARRVADA